MLNSEITIVIADDHPMMLKGLRDELLESGYKILGTAENGALALDLVMNQKPMIAILDIEMPLLSGFDVLRACKEQGVDSKFIMMTYHKEKGFLVQAKKFGAKGYLLKEDGIQDIQSCIQAVLKDEEYYSSSLNENIKNIVEDEVKKLKLLTPSERTIIRLVAQEKTSAEIAEQLSITKLTVSKHRSNIINKLDINKGVDSLTQWTREHKNLIGLL